MLELREIERQLLSAACALTTDDLGNEILAGLDENESIFVVSADRLGSESLQGLEREKYLGLMIRHRRERILLAAASLDRSRQKTDDHAS